MFPSSNRIPLVPLWLAVQQCRQSRYPSYFELRSGIEALKELVGSLKKGLDGLKKRFKDSSPRLKKESGSDIVSTAIKREDTALSDNLKEVNAYIAKIKQGLRQAGYFIGNQAGTMNKLRSSNHCLKRSVTSKHILKTAQVGDVKLTKEQSIIIGKEIARIPGWLKADPAYDNALGEADFDHIDGFVDIDAVNKLFWNYCSWEAVLTTTEQLSAEAVRMIRSSVLEMEQLIITSLKYSKGVRRNLN
ncbi:hypothetical protein ACTFIU_009038 [Dictyostelium citrinum]